MTAYSYKIKSEIFKFWKETKGFLIGNLVWLISPQTLIHNPTIDFNIIPKNFDLKNLTSCKVKNLMIEVGTGNGDFLSYISKKESRSLTIGFEVAKDYFLKTKNNISKNLRLNAKVSHADAYEVIKNNFSNSSISKIFINFPDPWPKKKQWKRRFITKEKFPILLKKVRSGGEIIFVTDHMEYATFVEDICNDYKEKELISFEVQNQAPPQYPETKYFKKWKNLGKKDYKTITIIIL